MPRKKSKPTRSPLGVENLVSTRVAEIVSDEPPKKKLKEAKLDRIDHLFESYSNKSLGLIEPEGIETLCKDVHVNPKDVKMLIFAWKMKAEKRGFISKDEWRRGLQILKVDTIRELRKKIHVLDIEMTRSRGSEDFYSYAFQYNLIEDHEHRTTLDIQTACEVLDVVLRVIFLSKVDDLIEFLKVQKEYDAITINQWRSFYRCLKEVNMVDLQGYDSSQSWPMIIHSFVKWLKEKEIVDRPTPIPQNSA